MIISVAVEVPFAGESAPAGEDSEGDDLALTEGGFRTRTLFRRLGLAKVVNHDIKCGEEGIHIDHELVPFPSGSGSRPTLERGCLPLKFRADNSHQAFKCVESAFCELRLLSVLGSCASPYNLSHWACWSTYGGADRSRPLYKGGRLKLCTLQCGGSRA